MAITIAEAAARKQPEYMLITLGVNGVSFMEEDAFTAEYTKLVESIQQASPNTKIICDSIFPVAASYANLSQINNTKITAANGWIESVAVNTGTRYLNTYEVLVGADGLQNGDGLHLTGEAFQMVIHYLRTHAYQ